MARHRVRDPRRADHARVRGDDQDRPGQDADVVAQRRELEAVQADVVDDPEHRVVGVAARRVLAEERVVAPAGDAVHRQRHQRDRRQRQVDREHRAGDVLVGERHVARRVARLLREVGDRLHPGVGDHPDRDREEELAPFRRDAEVDPGDQDVRVEDQRRAERDEQHLRREVDHGEHDVQPHRLPDPEHVERDEQQDHDRAADDVPRVLPERPPEDRQVVGDEERRDRDRDDVVEQLGPAGPERDHLVECVPREARRAACLRVADGALRVGRRRGDEEDPGDHEDERRQPERERGGQAERVVDRRADVAVRGREERRRAEHPLEAIRLLVPGAPRPAGLRDGRRLVRHGPRLAGCA